nr:MAG TPA: hypothetical protein [Caudoviricetes sp.]
MENNNYQKNINNIYESVQKALEPIRNIIENLQNSPSYKSITNLQNELKKIANNIKIEIPKIQNFKINDIPPIINQCLTTPRNISPITFDLNPIGIVTCPIEIKFINEDNSFDSFTGYLFLKDNNNILY